jgi:hypothetical protein
MNKKSRMMGDCHVRFCERLIMQKFGLLDSTKFRLNIAIGQRLTLVIPKNKRRLHNRVSLFYEVGTCDLYVRSMFQTNIPLKDILGLSIGLKFYTQ